MTNTDIMTDTIFFTNTNRILDTDFERSRFIILQAYPTSDVIVRFDDPS
jgi:hypothetical protein